MNLFSLYIGIALCLPHLTHTNLDSIAMHGIQDLPTDDGQPTRAVNLFEVNNTFVVPIGGIIEFLSSDGSIIFAPNDGIIGFQSTPLLGNTLRVDSIYGNDSTGTLGGPPFKTINAALSAASSGNVVWIFPGTYNESITIPTGVSVIGLTEGAGASAQVAGGPGEERSEALGGTGSDRGAQR